MNETINSKTNSVAPLRHTAVYRLADLDIRISCRYPYSAKLLKPYLTDGTRYDFDATPTEEDILAVDPESGASFAYLESLAILKSISNELLISYDGFLFHSSSLAYNGGGYAFTARSGTGKSTHARLLKELLGDELTYINDDKPFVRYFPDKDEFKIYGNPWNGKHGLGDNVSFPLKGVCILTRSENNFIKREKDLFAALSCLGNQILYPDTREQGEKFMELVSLLFEKVPFFRLGCNISEEAAKTSFEGMMRGSEK